MLKSILKFAGVVSAVVLPALAIAEPIKLRVTNGLSPTHDVSTHGIVPWMECMTERTGGDVTFDYFPGGQISTMTETTDAIAAGLADIGFMSPANEGSKLPLNGIAMLPGLGNSATEIAQNYRASIDAGSPLAQELDNLKLRPFIVNSLSPYQIMSRSGTIDTLEGFVGVKTRVSGGAMNFTALALKAIPTEMPAGELYIALERGTVDATILAKSSVKTYSLNEILASVSSNASLGTSTQFFAISHGSWDKLTEDQQDAVTTCGLEVEKSLAEYLDEQEEVLAAEFTEMGINVYEFSDEELARINTALKAASQL